MALTPTDQLRVAHTHLREAAARLNDAHCHLFNVTFESPSQTVADAAVDVADLTETVTALAHLLAKVKP